MSEETEVVETENATPEPEPVAPKGAFDTLFQSVNDTEEPEEEVGVPVTLDGFLEAEEQEVESVPVEEVEQPQETQVEAEDIKPAEPKKKVKRTRKVEDPEPEKIEEAEAEEVPSEDPFVNELIPQERDRYELAKYASGAEEKYKGLDTKYLEFFKKQKEYLDRRDADGDPIEDYQEDSDYQDFLRKNGVPLDPSEVTRLERARLKEEVREETLSETRAELDELRNAQKAAQARPKVDQSIQEYNSSLQEAIPEDLMKSIQEGGVEAAQKDFPFEFQIADTEIRRVQNMAKTLLEISSGLTALNPDEAVQSELIKFIDQEQTTYIETGDTKDDKGRLFMRRERFNDLPESDRSKYWTWSNEDLLKLMKFRAGQGIGSEIKKHQERMEAAGYVRKTQAAPAPVAAPAQAAPPTPPTPRPSAGSAPATPTAEPRHPLHVLGL